MMDSENKSLKVMRDQQLARDKSATRFSRWFAGVVYVILFGGLAWYISAEWKIEKQRHQELMEALRGTPTPHEEWWTAEELAQGEGVYTVKVSVVHAAFGLEHGMPGVRVELFQMNQPNSADIYIPWMLTDMHGYAEFHLAPGTYQMQCKDSIQIFHVPLHDSIQFRFRHGCMSKEGIDSAKDSIVGYWRGKHSDGSGWEIGYNKDGIQRFPMRFLSRSQIDSIAKAEKTMQFDADGFPIWETNSLEKRLRELQGGTEYFVDTTADTATDTIIGWWGSRLWDSWFGDKPKLVESRRKFKQGMTIYPGETVVLDIIFSPPILLHVDSVLDGEMKAALKRYDDSVVRAKNWTD